jgi:hypothetical protein
MAKKMIILFALAIMGLVVLFGNVLSPLVAPCMKTIKVLADGCTQNGWAGSLKEGAYPAPLYLPLVIKEQSLAEQPDPQINNVGQGGEPVEPGKVR